MSGLRITALGRRAVSLALGTAVAAASAAAIAGCGPSGPPQHTARAAKPPPGFRTIANRSGRFTFAAPRSWKVRRQKRDISVSSPTLATQLLLQSDRSPRGQRTPARRYAFETLRDLANFSGETVPGPARVPGSPYRNARVSAVGRLRSARGRQRVSVVALKLPDEVTFAVTVFGGGDAATVDRIVASLRAGVR